MSGFEEENPFAVSVSPPSKTKCHVKNYESLFVLKDPSVQKAVNSKPQANLEEYNPYGGTQQSGPAVMPSTEPPPPTYTPSNQQQVSSKDFEVISYFLFHEKT